MSYVQGTGVRLQADFSDPITRLPVVPAEIVLTIKTPSGTVLERTRSSGAIQADPDRLGRFFYLLDTTPEFGTWQYQFEAVGAIEDQVVERKSITVTKRLS